MDEQENNVIVYMLGHLIRYKNMRTIFDFKLQHEISEYKCTKIF